MNILDWFFNKPAMSREDYIAYLKKRADDAEARLAATKQVIEQQKRYVSAETERRGLIQSVGGGRTGGFSRNQLIVFASILFLVLIFTLVKCG